MKFVVDIDATLLYSIIKDNQYIITGGNEKLINTMNKLFDMGHEIIIWTGRHWNHLADTKKQLSENAIKYTTLMMGKPNGDYFIDDKAITPGEFVK